MGFLERSDDLIHRKKLVPRNPENEIGVGRHMFQRLGTHLNCSIGMIELEVGILVRRNCR